MNHIPALTLALALLPPVLHAESAYDREVQQLTEQRDKAAAAAVEPINRRYQSSLEQLLKRATQAGDLDAAVKIKALLDPLSAGSSTDSEAQLRTALTSAKWSWEGVGKDTITFTKSGEAKLSNSTSAYKISGQRKITLTSKVSGRTATLTLNATFTEFNGTDFDGHTPLHGALLK